MANRKYINSLNFESESIFAEEELNTENLNVSLSENIVDLIFTNNFNSYYENNSSIDKNKIKLAFSLDFIKEANKLKTSYNEDILLLNRNIINSYQTKCSDVLNTVLKDKESFSDLLNRKIKTTRTAKNNFINTINQFYVSLKELSLKNSYSDYFFNYIEAQGGFNSIFNGKIYKESLIYFEAENNSCSNIDLLKIPQLHNYTIENTGSFSSKMYEILYLSNFELFNSNIRYLTTDSDYFISNIIFNTIISISSIYPTVLFNITGENKNTILSYNYDFYKGYFLNNKHKIIYTSPDSEINFLDSISNNFLLNYNKLIEENSNKIISEEILFNNPEQEQIALTKNYNNFFNDYQYFSIRSEILDCINFKKQIRNNFYEVFLSLTNNNKTLSSRLMYDCLFDIRKLDFNSDAFSIITSIIFSLGGNDKFDNVGENFNFFLTNLKTTIGSQDTSKPVYYHFYKKSKDDLFISNFNINYPTEIQTNLPSLSSQFVKFESGFNESSVNNSFKKILFKSNNLVKSLKILKLEKNNIDFSFFKNILTKAKKNNQNDNSLNAFSGNDNKKISLLSEEDDFFKLLFTKVKENEYASNNNYFKNKTINNEKYNNSYYNVTNNVKLENLEEIKEKYYNFIKEYYIKSFFNNSFNLLNEIINDIKKESENMLDSALYKNYSSLQFLYFCCFENEIDISLNKKREIAKRIVMKTISKKCSVSSNLYMSKNGFIINTEDLSLLDYEINKKGQEKYIEDIYKSNDKIFNIKNSVYKINKNNSNINEFLTSKNFSSTRKHYSFPFKISQINEFQAKKGRSVEGYNNENFTEFIDKTAKEDFETTFKIENILLKNNQNSLKEYTSDSIVVDINLMSKYKFEKIENINSEGEVESISNGRNILIGSTRFHDRFDELLDSENNMTFNFMLNKVLEILKISTNVEDVYFNSLEDIDSFLASNDFVLDKVITLIEMYADIYNIYFRRLHDIIGLKYSSFEEEINKENRDNVISYIDKSIRPLAFRDFIEVYEYYISKKNNIDLNENILKKYTFYVENKFENNLTSISNTFRYTVNSYSIYNQLKLLSSDTKLQSFYFDILGSFIQKTEKNLFNIGLKKEELNSISTFYGEEIVDTLKSSHSLNLASKNIYNNLLYQEKFNKNNQEYFSDSNSSNNYNYFLNNTYDLFKDKYEIENNQISKTRVNKINLNFNKVFCFAMPLELAKELSFSDIIRIRGSVYSHSSPSEATNDVERTFNKYFSPLLTNAMSADYNVGYYDIEKGIKNRFNEINIQSPFDAIKIFDNVNNSFITSSRLGRVNKGLIIDSHAQSNNLENLCKYVYSCNINKDKFVEDINKNYSDIELTDFIFDNYDEIEFRRKFGNKTTKEELFNSLKNVENLELYEVKSLNFSYEKDSFVLETLKNTYNFTSTDCISKIFKNKKYYDVYYMSVKVPPESSIVFEIDILK